MVIIDFVRTHGHTILDIVYIIATIFTCIRVVIDTNSVQKTMSYLLIVLFIPIIGIIIYFSIGVNYRKNKMYNKKLRVDERRAAHLIRMINDYNKKLIHEEEKKHSLHTPLYKLLSHPQVSNSPIFKNNQIQLFYNGENLYPDILKEIEKAQHHIHLEYYIYENDNIGRAIKEALIKKAQEGVQIRFIYDDFGSHSIRKNIVKELNAVPNIEAYSFHEIKLLFLANRLNYRNHRKIIIIDGEIAYTGGLNVSDKYINGEHSIHFWRDTHVKIIGSAALGLQHVFLSDWNFCSGQDIALSEEYFPEKTLLAQGDSKTQILASGPDSDVPTILFMYLQAINAAQKEILLTTPYYIPDNSLQQMLILAALRGVKIKLLLPYHSDSKLVNWASRSYYDELLNAGIDIYLYHKGFIHAKSMVIDGQLAFVGTANLDTRSFDLNFEVGALMYDAHIASQLQEQFMKDIEEAYLINRTEWRHRSLVGQFIDKTIRLLSPLL